MRRVDEAVREVLGEAVTHDLKDPRVGFVTVTEVRTSPDLRQARVFVSVFGTDEEKAATLEGLRSAHGILQAKIASQLRMKRTPALEFALDDTAEKAARLEAIIEQAVEDPEP
ncbi:MAG: rbfA [Conexibacter sp.]|jgi:ribosome-binding factor A|nr:rbfA [Conexibacter sp.]MDX6717613.1 ribosome-binding factor [Baekduia sp.]